MADKQKKRFKWKIFSSVAYLFATAVGYLYATGYYGHFGIDILNHVEPIDLLFISLDNVHEVLVFSGLIVPIVLPLIILILAVAILLGLIVVLASLAVYFSFILILSSASLLLLAAAAVVSRRVANQIQWIGKTLRATFGRQQGTKKEGRPSTFGEKIRRLVTIYKEMAEAHPSKPTKENDYYTGAKEVVLRVPKVWSWIPQILRAIRNRTQCWMHGFFESESSWRPKGWTSMGRLRQLVVVATLAYIGAAAHLNGKIVAQNVRLDAEGATSGGQTTTPNGTFNAEDPAGADGGQITADSAEDADIETAALAGADTPDVESATTSDHTADPAKGASHPNGQANVEETWSKFLARSVICPILPLVDCEPEPRPVRTYAVPTSNLASLELNECKKESANNLKYARAHLRQDVSDGAHDATSDCHVYLGATGSMQFLADFHGTDDDRPPTGYRPDRQRSGPVVIAVGSGGGSPPPVELLDTQSFAVVFDARSGAVSAHACSLVAVVGPFQTGTAEMEGADEVCNVPGQSDRIGTIRDVGAIEDLGYYDTLVLVGRADVRPINNRDFESNMALATARVSEVMALLKQNHPGQRVLRISAGPVDSPQGADACSRVVEVYGCPANASSTSGATHLSAGEDASSSSNAVDDRES